MIILVEITLIIMTIVGGALGLYAIGSIIYFLILCAVDILQEDILSGIVILLLVILIISLMALVIILSLGGY